MTRYPDLLTRKERAHLLRQAESHLFQAVAAHPTECPKKMVGLALRCKALLAELRLEILPEPTT